jgi:hypothetical protein
MGASGDGAPPGLLELCKQILCRMPSGDIQLGQGRVFTVKQQFPLPILHNNLVAIYPGEQVFIEVEQSPEGLRLIRAVSEIQNPGITLSFRLHQEGANPETYLEVNNPLPVPIKFRMGMMVPDSADIYATSSCPVMAGLASYEQWPHPIFQLLVTDARILSEHDSQECIE